MTVGSNLFLDFICFMYANFASHDNSFSLFLAFFGGPIGWMTVNFYTVINLSINAQTKERAFIFNCFEMFKSKIQHTFNW